MSEVVIRRAGVDDLPALLSMAMRMYQTQDIRRQGLHFHTHSAESYLTHLVSSEFAILLMAVKDGRPVGMIAGVISPWMGEMSQLMLYHVLWWVEPERAGEWIGERLVKEFENWGRVNGVAFVVMGTRDFDGETAMIRWYRRLGYSHLQHHFMKKV